MKSLKKENKKKENKDVECKNRWNVFQLNSIVLDGN